VMWIAVESTFGSLWNARTISEHEASSARKLAHRYLESPGCNCGETAKWFISLCLWKLHAGILGSTYCCCAQSCTGENRGEFFQAIQTYGPYVHVMTSCVAVCPPVPPVKPTKAVFAPTAPGMLTVNEVVNVAFVTVSVIVIVSVVPS